MFSSASPSLSGSFASFALPTLATSAERFLAGAGLGRSLELATSSLIVFSPAFCSQSPASLDGEFFASAYRQVGGFLSRHTNEFLACR